jgi:hypothetical protein
MKKRLHLSLVALVGSVILFVVTSLAWFTVSEFVNIDFFSASVLDQEIEYVFYESDDGVTYTETTNLEFSLRSPGDIKYYRLVVTNPETSNYNVNIFLSGITDVNSDGSTYVGPESLTEVIQVTSTMDSSVLVDDRLDVLINGSLASVSNSFTLAGGQSKTLDFTLSIVGSADNTYQNLGIEIDQIKVYFDTQ